MSPPTIPLAIRTASPDIYDRDLLSDAQGGVSVARLARLLRRFWAPRVFSVRIQKCTVDLGPKTSLTKFLFSQFLSSSNRSADKIPVLQLEATPSPIPCLRSNKRHISLPYSQYDTSGGLVWCERTGGTGKAGTSVCPTTP